MSYLNVHSSGLQEKKMNKRRDDLNKSCCKGYASRKAIILDKSLRGIYNGEKL